MTRTSTGSTLATNLSNVTLEFLNVLGLQNRKRVTLEFDWDKRLDWHYIPKHRHGLPRRKMTDDELIIADVLMKTGLSPTGYRKAQSIINHENILRWIESQKNINEHDRNPGSYFFSVFGTPGNRSPWGWRVEGHHLSINYTISNEKIVSVTPSFFGANPAEVKDGKNQGLRILEREETWGRAFFLQLDSKQKSIASIFPNPPPDILTRADRKIDAMDPIGLSASSMTSDQRQSLIELIQLYIGRKPYEIRRDKLRKIEMSGIEHISFGWAGGTEPGQGHYYRIQGKEFLIEYDNTQDEANHIHAVWRDADGDFGFDALKDHYQKHHK